MSPLCVCIYTCYLHPDFLGACNASSTASSTESGTSNYECMKGVRYTGTGYTKYGPLRFIPSVVVSEVVLPELGSVLPLLRDTVEAVGW